MGIKFVFTCRQSDNRFFARGFCAPHRTEVKATTTAAAIDGIESLVFEKEDHGDSPRFRFAVSSITVCDAKAKKNTHHSRDRWNRDRVAFEKKGT